MDNHSKSRVLIVDDMRVNRMILSSLLASNGVSSDLAESGTECIELCRNNQYDLILLDHRMPEIDGVDTLLQLKQIFLKTGREIPVVCHTTEDAKRNINLYKAAGFADVLIKPIEPRELSHILMTYLPEGQNEKDEAAETSERVKEEMEKLPEWLKNVSQINLTSGIEHCETVKDYLDALTVFKASISEKAAEIEQFMKEENYKMYTIRVHSLKSMAKLIGAEKLSNEAAVMEYAGKHDDVDLILERTPGLLEQYRAFLTYLAPLDEIREEQV